MKTSINQPAELAKRWLGKPTGAKRLPGLRRFEEVPSPTFRRATIAPSIWFRPDKIGLGTLKFRNHPCEEMVRELPGAIAGGDPRTMH